jgi:putative membrane protein insertion efficiency factor
VEINRSRIIKIGLVLGVVLLLQTSLPLKAELFSIRIYQKIGSPVVRYMATCRYEPSCSHYAVQTLEEDGFWLGNWNITKRLFMCSPIGALIDVLRDP